MSRYLSWQNAMRWDGAKASVSLGSSTVTRVSETAEPDPEFKPRPVGFTAELVTIEVEPQVWEGDSA